MSITIEHVSKHYGELPVFELFSLELPRRSVTAVLGPSGCGKTTLLRLIAGLVEPDAGRVSGRSDEAVSYLFQEPRLLPWLSLEGNVSYVLPETMGAGERRNRAGRLLRLVGLEEFVHYTPSMVSGGMRQRAAMARAFAFPAQTILMDEPFQALDIALKLSLVGLFRRLWEDDPRTSVFVTHDVQEAVLLGDQIVVLSPRPAHVVQTWENPVERKMRSLEDATLLELERKVYHALLEGAS